MCLCWDKDENGKVIGICSTEELKRKIHDPDYMPELKARKAEMVLRHRATTRERKPLSEEAKSRAQQNWKDFLNH